MTTGSQPVTEPSMSWPTLRLLGTIATVAVLSAGGWVIAAIGFDDRGLATAGVAAAIIVGGFGLLGILIVGPWKQRRMSAWISYWIGGSVLRLLLIPAATYLLYSATSLNATALALSVGLTYVVTLFAEAAVLALHVQRTL